MRWHTDRPIARLRAVKALRPVAPIDMHRIGAPARVAYVKAQAYFRRKLRARSRGKDGIEPAD